MFIKIIIAVAITFLMGWLLRFPLYKVARCKRLSDVPNHRSSHNGDVPYVGGILIFASFSAALLVFVPSVFWEWRWVCLGAMLIFFIGLYDDILKISAYKKMQGEFFAISMAVICQGVYFQEYSGFLGMEMPMPFPIIATMLFMLVLINALNLIDGIDGLCSGVAMTDLCFLGIVFHASRQYEMSLVCVILFAAITPFFIINVFGKRIKMFLGDTGSLTLGFLLGILSVIYCNKIGDSSSLAMAGTIFALPVLDALRLFIFRILHRKSPFSPDKNHIHHRVLKLFGDNHWKSTLMLLTINLFFVWWAWLSRGWPNEIIALTTIGWFVFLWGGIEKLAKRKEQMEKAKIRV